MKTYSRLLFFVVLAAAMFLSGCSDGPKPILDSSGLVRGYSFAVAGTSYTVHRVTPRRNFFSISTDDGGPGNRAAMRRVVRLAYGCHALELSETKPNWQAAEVTGAVCTGGYQRYSSTR